MNIMRHTVQNNRESRKKQLARRFGLLLFLMYLVALTYFLFFADWYDHAPGKHWQYHYNLIPLMEIRRFLKYQHQLRFRAVFLNLFGNVVGFLPFGFFLPVIAKRNRSLRKVTFLGFLTSTAVELTQLVTRSGVCDIDDVILNTLGAAAGYLLFLACDTIRLRRKYHGK